MRDVDGETAPAGKPSLRRATIRRGFASEGRWQFTTRPAAPFSQARAVASSKARIYGSHLLSLRDVEIEIEIEMRLQRCLFSVSG